MEVMSDRGRAMASDVSLLEQGMKWCLEDPYDQHSNPQGFINFGVAENRVCLDLLQERLSRPDMNCLGRNALGYNATYGLKSMREETARFLSHYCRSPSPLNPDNIVIMSGCSAVICALTAVIGNPGDAFLTPAPYYSGLSVYTWAYPGLQILPVPLSSQVTEENGRPFQLTIKHLEDGMQKANQRGINIKALILTNPQNPLGEVYSAEVLEECLEFGHRYNLHVILDEIFLLSVIDTPFTSVLSLHNVPDPEHTHFIWGVSKDFGMGGCRVAVLHTENKDILRAVSRLAFHHECAGPVQHAVSRLLGDRDWLDDTFLPTSKQRMRKAQRTVISALQEMGISVHSRATGIFVWADLSKYLTSPTFEAETELWKECIEEKVCVTPGKNFHCCQPGWFRVTTSLPEDILQIGLQRLKKVLLRRLK
ncbi:1-aminocyclopropane-1-carboxylate synthase-like protein 1 [Hyperolius riggenbachi]|uniref:1-aminocyclopropane-1-carboxylate synthase-like protein 1 n=1 Tax=Hyperolius riggenbachi TaxID=752182 RepID=UPI0035A373DA